MQDFIISCIIPVYNTAEYLDNCIMSIINQKQIGVQIVLVDDGSTDDSAMICDKYKSMYSDFITLIHKENGGLSDARNTGVQYAKGKFLWFIDSDDYVTGNIMAKVLPLLKEEVDIYEMGYTIHNTYKEQNVFPVIMESETEVTNFLKKSLKRKSYDWFAWRYLFNRNFYMSNNFLFPLGRNYEDIYLIPRILLKAKSIMPLEYIAYIYNSGRSGSITSESTLKNQEDCIWVAANVVKDLEYVSDYELKVLFYNMISKVYYYQVINLFKNKSRTETKQMIEILKEYKYLTKYSNEITFRIINISLNLLGIKITSILLNIFLKIKRKRKQ